MQVKTEMHFQTLGRDTILPEHLREGKIEAKFGVKLPLDKALTEPLLTLLHVPQIVTAIAKLTRTWKGVGENKDISSKDKKARAIGSGLRYAGDIECRPRPGP